MIWNMIWWYGKWTNPCPVLIDASTVCFTHQPKKITANRSICAYGDINQSSFFPLFHHSPSLYPTCLPLSVLRLFHLKGVPLEMTVNYHLNSCMSLNMSSHVIFKAVWETAHTRMFETAIDGRRPLCRTHHLTVHIFKLSDERFNLI